MGEEDNRVHDFSTTVEDQAIFKMIDGQLWYEEEIDDDLKWSFKLKSVLNRSTSKYQEIALLDTEHFGKVLVIDGKMQSAELDEFIYHECLIHPPLLCHPKQEVVDFCKTHLTENHETFLNKKLCLVINCARTELEKRDEKYDIIVGDLADPVEGGPCYKLYTRSFYEQVLKPKLNPQGIFVTQGGPAGVFTHKEVFSSIYNTLKQVFKHVIAYNAYVPSFADSWGWIMASDDPIALLNEDELDKKIGERINGELVYLNGKTIIAAAAMNKLVHESLLKETHVYTEEDLRFIYGHGKGCF